MNGPGGATKWLSICGIAAWYSQADPLLHSWFNGSEVAEGNKDLSLNTQNSFSNFITNPRGHPARPPRAGAYARVCGADGAAASEKSKDHDKNTR